MLNIGNNPTVNAEVNGIFLEAHILDFSGNLYSRKLKIVLLKRIRDEKKFPSLDDLKRQLSEDKRVTAEMF
jgi:riboflavin kinase/FMN adenylyltransferase